MRKILKWLGIHVHEWGEWEDAVATMSSALFKGEWEQVVQVRRCKTCGMQVTRKVS